MLAVPVERQGGHREVSEMPSTESRRWGVWTSAEEGTIGGMPRGGAPVTGPRFGSCHCASASALSIFRGDGVPPDMELSQASHSGSCYLLEFGECYEGCRIHHLISLSNW